VSGHEAAHSRSRHRSGTSVSPYRRREENGDQVLMSGV
jgi:hypothetical protein